MGKRYKNKVKKIFAELLICILVVIAGYFGIDLVGDKFVKQDEVLVSSNNYLNIENVQTIDFNNNKLNIIFFYVGQADATLIKINDASMLIDSGNNEDGTKISEFLKRNNINKLDYLVGTHADEDHIGGMDKIIEEIEVGKILLSKVGSEAKDYIEILDNANRKDIQIEYPVRGDKFYLDSCECEIMSALEDDVSDNNSSIVIQMKYLDTAYLFMGDAEKEVENSREWNQVDVLKVGHHGSNSSNSEEFLSQVRPKYAVIEVGKNNAYNLPNEKTIERLTKVGCNILRTDESNNKKEGSFWLISDGKTIDIKQVDINLDGNA